MSVQKNKKQSRGLQLIAGGTLWADCPIGTIIAYSGSTAPDGWLLCQGQEISRTEYVDLFAVIGTKFGPGDGSSTFNVPDLSESVLAVGTEYIIKSKLVPIPADLEAALEARNLLTFG